MGADVLGLLVASLLACPPTTLSKPSASPGHFMASPHGWPTTEDPAQPASEPPDPRELPLWDLEATRAQLGPTDDDVWLIWVLDEAESKPESAHQALASALASASSAERMLWWLATRPRPATSDALDALSDAWFVSEAPRTRLLLAIALALFNYADSCPVELGIDGACRMPGSSLGQVHDSLIRRDGIALERANEWNHRARALAKRAKLDPSELALHALLAELELASATEDYESVLVARTPQDLEFEVDWFMQGSGFAPWERRYEVQVERATESNRRFESFYVSAAGCVRSQFEGYSRVEDASANAMLRVWLRQAKLLLAFPDIDNPRSQRADDRHWREHHERPWGHGSADSEFEERALERARQCVEFGTTRGGDASIVEACFDLLEAHDPRYPPLGELVPEPGARVTTMHAIGVIPLELGPAPHRP